MHEIGVRARRDAGEYRVLRTRDRQVVPAHVRDLQARRRRRQNRDLAVDPAEPGMLAVFAADARHQLHADADAEKRPTVVDHRSVQGLDHAGQRLEPPPAVGERADARQHDPLGAADLARIAADLDRTVQAALGHGALERLRRRSQVAGAVVDDDDGHRTRSAANCGL